MAKQWESTSAPWKWRVLSASNHSWQTRIRSPSILLLQLRRRLSRIDSYYDSSNNDNNTNICSSINSNFGFKKERNGGLDTAWKLVLGLPMFTVAEAP
jgi:hypothetical protein